MATEKIGEIVGQYQLERLLGQGGMGAVYQAQDLQLERPVALKLMRPEAMSREEFRRRFLQEARAIAKLDHPNIVKIYSFQADDARHFLAMEYISGGSLRDYIDNLQNKGKQVPIREVLTLCRHVAAALDYAHARGMIHRDVKPDNVLLKLTMTSGSTEVGFNGVLTDFGLAKLKADPLVQTQENMAMGTLPYMSPEQLKGQPVDGRTDIYAVGVMMYELICGRRPYSPKKLYDALDMHDNNPPTPPSQLRPDVTPELETLVMRSMAKNPEDRYQSGHKLVRAIQEVEKQYEHVQSEPDSDGFPVAPTGQEERIATYLSSMPHVIPDDSTQQPEVKEYEEPHHDEIIVQSIDFERRYPIARFPFSIGRDELNDISLPSKKVSRQHARLERRPDGQYMLTDLKSTNGCFIDGRRVNAGVPHPWHPGEIVRIGEFEMMLEIAQRAEYDYPADLLDSPTLPKPPENFASPDPYRQPEVRQPFRGARDSLLRIRPDTLNVHPGMKGELVVELTNDRDYDELFQIRVRNLPEDWRFLPATLTIQPHQTNYQTVKFTLPQNLNIVPGTYEFLVEALGHQAGAVVAVQAGNVVIPPVYGFAIRLDPYHLNGSGDIRLMIINQGNLMDSYAVSVRCREEGELYIEPADTTIRLNPGQETYLTFSIKPGKRRFMRGAKQYPVDFYVTASNGESKVETAHATI